MENFAEYILSEKEIASKMEIVYYLSKKTGIFFDKSFIFKTELLRLFLNYSKIDVDSNLLLTASLLCNCKKSKEAQDINKIHTYAKEGAQYLRSLGFEKKFCKICEEINRYSNSNPREKESDILELIDNFGGMLLDRPERIGFKPDEAIVLLEHRNLKNEYNRYLNTFIDFVNFMEGIRIDGSTGITVLRKLIKYYNGTINVTEFIKKVIYKFEPKADKMIECKNDELANKMFGMSANPNRSLFSEETTKKILSHISEESVSNISE